MHNQSMKNRVINDPIHKIMKIGSHQKEWLKPIIDHPIFQRLRNIKQLGLAELVFPSATHNRFSHSIGTSYIAKKIAEQLNIEEKHTQILTIASLLHDIGHGPISHVFEVLLNNICNETILHEEWTPLFIDELCTDEFIDSYNKLNPNHALSKDDFMLITSLISGNKHPKGINSLFADIISSQLDADRMDYLLRDSHFCGVTYGQFDLDWLINCLTCHITPEGNYRLAITEKGINVAEQYLIARSQMNKGIYYHKKVVALEFLLIQFLTELINELQTNKTFFKFLDNNPLINFLNQIKRIDKSNKQTIMRASYNNYKQLCDFDIHYLIRSIANIPNNENKSVITLATLLQNRIIPLSFKINSNKTTMDLIAETKQSLKLKNWQLYTYHPNFTIYEKEFSPILIYKNNQIYDLSNKSKVINQMSNIDSKMSFLFIDKKISSTPEIKRLINKLSKEKAIE